MRLPLPEGVIASPPKRRHSHGKPSYPPKNALHTSGQHKGPPACADDNAAAD